MKQIKISLQNDGRKRTILCQKLSFDDLNELAENFTKTKCYTLIFLTIFYIIEMMN